MNDWADFLGKGLETGRRAVLADSIPLPQILRRITAGNSPRMRIIDGRPEWTITPGDLEALDLFFNGACGYRAAYAHSTAEGVAANAQAIAILASWLRDGNGALLGESVARLLGRNSKVWIREREDGRIHPALLDGQIAAREVNVPAWVEAAEARTCVDTFRGPRYKAAAGLLAPKPRTLIVKGEWLPVGTEPRKATATRSHELHRYGFS